MILQIWFFDHFGFGCFFQLTLARLTSSPLALSALKIWTYRFATGDFSAKTHCLLAKTGHDLVNAERPMVVSDQVG